MEISVAQIQNFDIVDSIDGVTISLWTAGCPHKCKGCHNPELWDDSNFPKMKAEKVLSEIREMMKVSVIKKNFSILGGEPLIPENEESLAYIISEIKKEYPNISIYLWTGYTLKELKKRHSKNIRKILKNLTYLIDGRFEEENKKILKLRGSSNQNIYKRTVFGLKKTNL